MYLAGLVSKSTIDSCRVCSFFSASTCFSFLPISTECEHMSKRLKEYLTLPIAACHPGVTLTRHHSIPHLSSLFSSTIFKYALSGPERPFEKLLVASDMTMLRGGKAQSILVSCTVQQ